MGLEDTVAKHRQAKIAEQLAEERREAGAAAAPVRPVEAESTTKLETVTLPRRQGIRGKTGDLSENP